MSVIIPPVIASWEPPVWCDTASVSEDGIRYYRPIGTLFPVDTGESAFTVAVVQSDILAPSASVVGVERGTAGVVVLGVRLTVAEALELAMMLTEAAGLIGGEPSI